LLLFLLLLFLLLLFFLMSFDSLINTTAYNVEMVDNILFLWSHVVSLCKTFLSFKHFFPLNIHNTQVVKGLYIGGIRFNSCLKILKYINENILSFHTLKSKKSINFIQFFCEHFNS